MASQDMRYVKFGSSDMMVSEVCAGTMTWGSFCTEEQAFQQLDAAVARGVNFIDTAEMYPVPPRAETLNKTEVIIGNWLEARTKEGKVDRSKLYIATKVCGTGRVGGSAGKRDFQAAMAARADPLGPRPPKDVDEENGDVTALTPEQMLAACQASLARLRCDYIDLYQLHWPQRYAPIWGASAYAIERERAEDPATPEAFDRQVLGVKALLDAKLIRYWGLSNETPFGVMSFIAACDRHGVPRPVSLQNGVSMLNRSYEGELAEVCRHFNIAGMPYGALCGGTLSGKYNDGEPANKEARHVKFPQFQARHHGPAALAASRKYAALAREHGLTSTQLALAWMRSRWWNTSVIIGTTSVEQMEENIDAFKVELSPEVLSAIDAIHLEHRNPTQGL